MAIFHLCAKVICRSTGGNAIAAAAYRAGQRLVCERTGRVHNYTRKTEVAHREILLPAGAPEWMNNREALWNAVEDAERRKDAQLCREVEVALPLELSLDQQVSLLRKFVREAFVAQGMVADMNIHAKERNPHGHIQLTMRDVTADGFGKKNRDWNKLDLVDQWREMLARYCNEALEQAGYAGVRVDHRSLAEQGRADLPTVHVGRFTGLERQCSKRGFNRAEMELREANAALARIQAQQQRVRDELVAIEAEMVAVDVEAAGNMEPAPVNAAPEWLWAEIAPAPARRSQSKPAPVPSPASSLPSPPPDSLLERRKWEEELARQLRYRDIANEAGKARMEMQEATFEKNYHVQRLKAIDAELEAMGWLARVVFRRGEYAALLSEKAEFIGYYRASKRKAHSLKARYQALKPEAKLYRLERVKKLEKILKPAPGNSGDGPGVDQGASVPVSDFGIVIGEPRP